VHRRSAALSVLLAVTLTGCGGSSAVTSTKKAGTPASPSPAELPLTKAEATTAAGAINLTAADVGAGYKSSPASKDATTQKEDAEFAACVGSTLPSAAVADVSSPDFSQGTGLQTHQVSSDVTVLHTTTEARRDLAAFKSAKTSTCLKTFITKALATQAGGSVTFAPPVVTAVPASAPGTDGAFGYDLKMTAKSSGITISFDVVIQAFLVKRCEVDLSLLSIGAPFPAADRDRLFATLVARAKTSAV
jgi:hypothetical protein